MKPSITSGRPVPVSSSSPSALLNAVSEAGLPPESLGAAESIGLLQALSAVPDPRKARGRRHGLQSILLLAVGAVLAGARSYAAIAQWAAHAEQAVSVCGPTPHATTFGRVLAAVDAAALQRALTGWVLARRQDRQRQRPACSAAR
ncbi:transposase family protein [Geodermatophilus obscurus]|uniref:transposase family protein n=1 Tax=Geodermatophilus obscurus TaxID=1861 RepID=UPI001AD900C0|nr:transposase family protein [Geodermatophilus obscurus]